MRLLLVEDSVLLAEQIRRELRELQGLQLLGPALGADAALQLAREHQPELLLIDLAPGAGLQLLERLVRAVPSCRVLVLSHEPNKALHARCLAVGAVAVFTKPEGLPACLQALRESFHIAWELSCPSATSPPLC